MKSIVSATALVFLLLFVTVTTFASWRHDHEAYYALGPSGYRIVDVSNDLGDHDRLVPRGANLRKNDVEQVTYIYTVHVHQNASITSDIGNIVLHHRGETSPNHFGLVDARVSLLSREPVTDHPYDIIELEAVIFLNQPTNTESQTLLMKLNRITFDLDISID